MAHVQARIGEVDYAVTLNVHSHVLTADEPQALGGKNAGPAPYELLLASLGACTAITLRMYAKRKQLPVRSVHVDLRLDKTTTPPRLERALTIEGELTEEQRTRMLEISEKTPVTLTLKSGLAIHTSLRT